MTPHTIPADTTNLLERLREVRLLCPGSSTETPLPEQTPVEALRDIYRKFGQGALIIVEDVTCQDAKEVLRVTVVVQRSPLIMDVHYVQPLNA
jgi:hypothetical protein